MLEAAGHSGREASFAVGARSFVARLALLLCISTPALMAQGQYGWLKNSPAEHFNDQDWSLLRQTVQETLNGRSAGESKSWKNDSTGHYGTVTVQRAYKSAEGGACKSLQLTSYAEGKEGKARYDYCQDSGGKWRQAPPSS
jgi:surface antigen